MAKFCTNCGNPLEEGQTVCPACGNVISTIKIVTDKVFNNNSTSTYSNVDNTNKKSKIAAIILAFFIGTYGIHDFYLGYIRKGIVHLALALIPTSLKIGVFFLGGGYQDLVSLSSLASTMSSLWAMYELILIAIGKISTDANGNPLV